LRLSQRCCSKFRFTLRDVRFSQHCCRKFRFTLRDLGFLQKCRYSWRKCEAGEERGSFSYFRTSFDWEKNHEDESESENRLRPVWGSGRICQANYHKKVRSFISFLIFWSDKKVSDKYGLSSCRFLKVS
jgi:hypothetical protein